LPYLQQETAGATPGEHSAFYDRVQHGRHDV
jgi:hypothetical protein